MRERPILFSGEMVKAILDGRKTQTRRVIKPQPPEDCAVWAGWLLDSTAKREIGAATWTDTGSALALCTKLHYVKCPYGKPGDRLWVRENWAAHPFLNSSKPRNLGHHTDIVYRCDPEVNRSHYMWRPSIFMPRWASRITLEITGVRVEQLQNITPANCKAEGISMPAPEHPTVGEALSHLGDYHRDYVKLWNSIAKRGCSWNTNPWVFVIEFLRIQQ